MRSAFWTYTVAASMLLTVSALAATPADTLTFNDSGDGILVNDQPYVNAIDPNATILTANVDRIVEKQDGGFQVFLTPVSAYRTGPNGEQERVTLNSLQSRPFAQEESWKMYDASGKPTADVRYAAQVVLPYSEEAGAAVFESSWNECAGKISGNYTGHACLDHRGLANEYMAYLNQNLIPCVNVALRAVRKAPATRVHLMHDGTSADERHSGGSLHSAGRAIDILTVTTYAKSGATNVFDFRDTSSKPRGRDRRFYEAFRACWGGLMDARGCEKRKDGVSPTGTMGWEDRRHIGHHLHTSYPFCPDSRGYFITKAKKQ